MINIGELLLLFAYLGVVLYVASVANRLSAYYWLAAVGVVICWGLLQWQNADRDLRIAERDRQHVAEVAK